MLQILVVLDVVVGLVAVHLHNDIYQVLELQLAADAVLLAVQVLIYDPFNELGLFLGLGRG